MPYLPEFEPPFIISTQNIMFMALQQASAANVELQPELQEVADTHDVQTKSDHPDYVQLLKQLTEQFSNK